MSVAKAHQQNLGSRPYPARIVGDHDDPSLMQAGDLLATQLTEAEKVVIPNTAYLLHLEQPALFQQTVLDFLRSRLD